MLNIFITEINNKQYINFMILPPDNDKSVYTFTRVFVCYQSILVKEFITANELLWHFAICNVYLIKMKRKNSANSSIYWIFLSKTKILHPTSTVMESIKVEIDKSKLPEQSDENCWNSKKNLYSEIFTTND